MEAMPFGDEQYLKLNRSVVDGNTYDFMSVQFRSTDDVYLCNLWSIRSNF